MSANFVFETDWVNIDSGVPEERSSFAELGIRVDSRYLTEAEDLFRKDVGSELKIIRSKVYLPTYKLAEWLVWNWWRLRWEPGGEKRDIYWAMAHCMATIGSDYVWPNITVISDGEHVFLHSNPTDENPAEPLRYISDYTAALSIDAFDKGIDSFLYSVLDHLNSVGLADTNLHKTWSELNEERNNNQHSLYRKFEALLGFDPDKGNENLIKQLISDIADVGESNVAELASNSVAFTVKQIRDIAKSSGSDANLSDAISLNKKTAKSIFYSNSSPWNRGFAAAKALRDQEGFIDGPLNDKQLSALIGAPESLLAPHSEKGFVSFQYANESMSRVFLMSKHPYGRRFQLARLVGDRVHQGGEGRLFPATDTNTVRQKIQRSFAAELLCPFNYLKDFMEGDYSDEAILEAAHHFRVGDVLIKNSLTDHGLIRPLAINR